MFALLGPIVLDLHQSMFLSLRKHGLTLSDIRVKPGSSNLSGANVTYGLNTFNASVRVWMDRVEVSFADLKRDSHGGIKRVEPISHVRSRKIRRPGFHANIAKSKPMLS